METVVTHRARFIVAVMILLVTAPPAFALVPDALHLRGLTLRVGEEAPPARFGREAGDDLHLIHFDHIPGRVEREALTGMGAEILGYLPVNGYLLRAPLERREELAALPGVDIFVPYLPEWRLEPRLLSSVGRGSGASRSLTLCFAPGEPARLRADQATALGAELIRSSAQGDRPLLWLRAGPELFESLAALPGLLWLESTGPIVERNDKMSWIVQSGWDGLFPIWERGIHGEGQIFGHIDSGMDRYSCFFHDPEDDPPGPDHRKMAFVGVDPGSPNPSHGTHTAGTLAGDALPIDGGMGVSNRGLAWAARLAHSSYADIYAYDPYADFMLHSDAGARVHSNSFGIDVIQGTNDPETRYILMSRAIDAFSHDREGELVLFASTNKSTLRAQENAKNVLSVGATWTHGYLGDEYMGFNEHRYGGLGPTADGRRKPEIYAPGAGIVSAMSGSPCGTVSKSGTSMACPAVSAGGGLIRQYLTEGWWPGGAADAENAITPSGALLKALLLNGTLPMDSSTASYGYPPEVSSGYPNDLEGWGRLLLDEVLYFEGDSRELWMKEQRNAQGLETGEQFYCLIEVESADEPLAITMVFTDPPGELLAAEPVINDLDLSLEGPGGVYFGNIFDSVAEESVTDGEPDPVNTVERIILKDPAPGLWTIRVRARSVPLGPQGYALAVNGDLTGTVQEYVPDAGFVAMLQNYPNPFVAGGAERGGTTLSFELRAGQRASLRIYDVAGRLVRTVAEGSFAYGVTERVWDGLDDTGEKAASGIYFARLETDQGAEVPVVRIVLLR